MTICLKLLVIILLGTVKERKQRSGFPHSSYYSINCGKVDLIKQLPVRASPILFMTEATLMVCLTFSLHFLPPSIGFYQPPALPRCGTHSSFLQCLRLSTSSTTTKALINYNPPHVVSCSKHQEEL